MVVPKQRPFNVESSTGTLLHATPVGVPHEQVEHVAASAERGSTPPAIRVPQSGPHGGGAAAPA
jgi:hypothetical protein